MEIKIVYVDQRFELVIGKGEIKILELLGYIIQLKSNSLQIKFSLK